MAKLIHRALILFALLAAIPATASADDSANAEGHSHDQEGEQAESGHGHEGDAHGDAHSAHAINWWDMSNGPDGDTPPLGFMFINFALLLVLVFMIMRKPIRNRVQNRHKSIKQALKEAEALKAEAEAALAAAKERMEAVDLEMAKLRKDVLDAGEAQTARIAGEADSRASRMQQDTGALVEQEVARMSADIREEVVGRIVASAQEVITQKIQAADHDRLAREYVASLGKTVTPDEGRQRD